MSGSDWDSFTSLVLAAKIEAISSLKSQVHNDLKTFNHHLEMQYEDQEHAGFWRRQMKSWRKFASSDIRMIRKLEGIDDMLVDVYLNLNIED